MIKTVNAEIFTYDGDKIWGKEKQKKFFDEHGKDAIIELVSKKGKKHITYESMVGEARISDIRINLSADVFEEAFKRSASDGELTWIVCDNEDNYSTVLKATPSYYFHFYRDGELDLSFLNKYDTVVLYGLNEYGVELYTKALPYWTGKRVILCGEWPVMGNVLPGLAGKEIILQSNWDESLRGIVLDVGGNALHIVDRLAKNEGVGRLDQDNIVTIGELMSFTFCFNNLQHFGDKNPDKKFFVINGRFSIEGIFGIQEKVFTMARYAKSRGYIPIFYINSSPENMYSDFEGDDIWGKFMNQLEDIKPEELLESKNVYFSPNANCLSILRHMYNEATPKDIKLEFKNGLYNEQVEKYIEEHGRILTEPENTLGVLIRGTDYQKTQFPGHPIHATVEMMISKISEIEKTRPYKYIYLATEDAEVLEQMKAEYGDRLIYTDQERYVVEPGKLLASVHGEETKAKGKGFRLGAEYLCTLRLLSRCESLLASGKCGGVKEAIKENGGKYRMKYVFDLGINPRV